MDHQAAAFPLLPAGSGRPRPGDHKGAHDRIVLRLLHCARCYSTELLCPACHLSSWCSSPRAKRGWGEGRHRRGGHGGGTGRRSTPTPPAPAGVPWPSINNPWSGHISMWPFQCPGGLLLSTSQRPCSRAPLLRSCRPGLHPRSPARLSPGLADGTRLLWHSPSLTWGWHRQSVPTGLLTRGFVPHHA